MTTLCYLDDAHRRYTSGIPEPTKCGRTIEGVTSGVIPLGANATRDRTLVSCPECKAKLVDIALGNPHECPECLGSGNTAYAMDDYKRCGVCDGTGRVPFKTATVTARFGSSSPNFQNLPRKK